MADNACHVIIHILDHRFVSKLASHDVKYSSIIRQTPPFDAIQRSAAGTSAAEHGPNLRGSAPSPLGVAAQVEIESKV
jgi:hypothetical protein